MVTACDYLRHGGLSGILPAPFAEHGAVIVTAATNHRPLAQMYIQMYADGRLFSWDERKSAANLAERGFDFEFASLIFAGPTLECEDTRRDYGERRVIAIGTADGIPIVVVYTDRATSGGMIERRVISARRASRKERSAHEAAVKAGEAQSRPRGP